LFALVALASSALTAGAATFNVVTNGSAGDNNLANNVCDIAGGGCTLHAAIQQANATAGFDRITLGRAKITLTQSLPAANERVVIDGSFGGGRATAPEADTSTSGSLHWNDGESGSKTIQVPIVGDLVTEPAQTFSLQLSNPQGGAELANPGSAAVTIDVSTPVMLQSFEVD
jgi:hypothetical protein